MAGQNLRWVFQGFNSSFVFFPGVLQVADVASLGAFAVVGIRACVLPEIQGRVQNFKNIVG